MGATGPVAQCDPCTCTLIKRANQTVSRNGILHNHTETLTINLYLLLIQWIS